MTGSAADHDEQHTLETVPLELLPVHQGLEEDGSSWRADAATAANFAISGGQGVISGGSTNYNGILGPTFGNGEVSFSGSMHTFHDTNIGAVLAYADPDNWYKAYLDGSSLVVQKRVSGVATVLFSVPFAAAPDTAYSVRFKLSDGVLSAKAWQAGSAEPAEWMAWVADSTFSSGSCGIRSLVQGPGASASYSAFRCTRAG